jgi:hypothetical protein
MPLNKKFPFLLEVLIKQEKNLEAVFLHQTPELHLAWRTLGSTSAGHRP